MDVNNKTSGIGCCISTSCVDRGNILGKFGCGHCSVHAGVSVGIASCVGIKAGSCVMSRGHSNKHIGFLVTRTVSPCTGVCRRSNDCYVGPVCDRALFAGPLV